MTKAANRVIRLIADMAEEERESLTLSALRDTQQPRLNSGELRVAHSKTVAEAMQ